MKEIKFDPVRYRMEWNMKTVSGLYRKEFVDEFKKIWWDIWKVKEHE